MRVLQVAYPFEAVSPASAGGSEQMVWLLDRELCALGLDSVVLARAGSLVTGRLVESAAADADYAASRAALAAALARLLAAERFDVVHDQGAGLQHDWRHATPLLTTLHLARRLYAADPLRAGPGCHVTLVSQRQRAEYPEAPPLPVIGNAVALDRFAPAGRRAAFAFAIGRFCPEKGLHHACDAAAAAGVPLVLAGRVYDFASHWQYFHEALLPRLAAGTRLLWSPPAPVKRAFLAAARCVLIPSEIEETSSIVAMEAAASGTPVVCFRRGALPEIVEDGVTGFVVDDVAGMADAIARCATLDAARCRARAEARFDPRAMAEAYVRLYAALRAGVPAPVV